MCVYVYVHVCVHLLIVRGHVPLDLLLVLCLNALLEMLY